MAMMPHRRLLYTIILIALLVLLCTFTATNAYFGYLGNLSGNGGPLMFTFFTNDTTILLGFSSLLYVITVSASTGKIFRSRLFLRRSVTSRSP
jgi:hypothetical protein